MGQSAAVEQAPQTGPPDELEELLLTVEAEEMPDEVPTLPLDAVPLVEVELAVDETAEVVTEVPLDVPVLAALPVAEVTVVAGPEEPLDWAVAPRG